MDFSILLYHGIDSSCHPYRSRDEKELEWVISLNDFESQMGILHDKGYSAMTLNDLLLRHRTGSIPKKPIIITFDDGHETNYINAWPVLDRYGFKAEFFITTDWIGTANYMSRSQLLEMRAAGMSIQSHARSHRFLHTMPDDELRDELLGSRCKLSELLGREVKYISYPGGRHDQRVEDIARETGYEGTYTAIRGINKNLESVFGLKRNGLTCNTSVPQFKALLSNSCFAALAGKTRSLARRVINIS